MCCFIVETNIYIIGEVNDITDKEGYILSRGYPGSLYSEANNVTLPEVEVDEEMHIYSLDLSISFISGALFISVNTENLTFDRRTAQDTCDCMRNTTLTSGFHYFCTQNRRENCGSDLKISGPAYVTVGLNVRRHFSEGALLFFKGRLFIRSISYN